MLCNAAVVAQLIVAVAKLCRPDTVAAGVAKSHETVYGDVRNARVAKPRVAIKAWNAKLSAGVHSNPFTVQ